MRLLVNNAWSGSCILHTRANTAGAYVDRCVQLHNDTTGEEPDVIAVFMGTNDYSYYKSALGTADINYDALITENADGTSAYAAPATACEAYAIMLHKMIKRYPDAEIYCMTMLPRRDPTGTHAGQPTAFNAELVKVIDRFGCTAVDLENCGITPDPENFDIYITDQRVHPGPLGMDKMTQALIDAMMGEENAAFTVSQNLVNVTANTSAGVVLAGESWEVALTPAPGFGELTVTVTVGGQDLTESVYADGVIHIPAVTGDVVITASAVIDDTPDQYSWEINGNSFVNVVSEEKKFDSNALVMKAGSIVDGVIRNGYFQMETPVVLCHNLPWVVEWRTGGTNWSGMLLASNANSSAAGNSYLFKTTQNTGFIGFGEPASGSYCNY
jgi:lysophospholipase L1-like esterase